MSNQTIPDLEGFDTNYGIPISAIGEDGALIVLGHHDRRRTVAALNRYSRKLFGFASLLDDPAATYADAEVGLHERWAVLVTECDDRGTHDDYTATDGFCPRCREIAEAMWWIRYDAAETDPGAFPVMVWEV